MSTKFKNAAAAVGRELHTLLHSAFVWIALAIVAAMMMVTLTLSDAMHYGNDRVTDEVRQLRSDVIDTSYLDEDACEVVTFQGWTSGIPQFTRTPINRECAPAPALWTEPGEWGSEPKPAPVEREG